MDEVSASRPDWNRLFETAVAQEGLFTTKQAAEAGYSPQLLVHYVHTRKAVRVRRGVYRLVHFPAGEHEELVTIWLTALDACRRRFTSCSRAGVIDGFASGTFALPGASISSCWLPHPLEPGEDQLEAEFELMPAVVPSGDDLL